MSAQDDVIARLKARIKQAGWGVSIDEALAFEHAELNALTALWRQKQAARGGLPRREDLDMRLLKPFLRHITIVEKVPDERGAPHFRFRLQGTLLAQHFGDQTGKLLEDVIPPQLIEPWNVCYSAILEAGRPLRVLTFYGMEQVNYLTGESFSVALGNGDDPPVSVLTCTYFVPRHMKRPDED